MGRKPYTTQRPKQSHDANTATTNKQPNPSFNSQKVLLVWVETMMISSVARRVARPTARTAFQSAVRAFSTKEELAPGANVVVPLIANSLEFTLSKPPPLHQFVESPIVVETEHLDLHPGKEAEEVLALQGEEVTDIIGKEGWTFNDPAKYEGLIPQNNEWTEFVDEKTGEWVYLDVYGNRVDKPVET